MKKLTDEEIRHIRLIRDSSNPTAVLSKLTDIANNLLQKQKKEG